MPGQNWFMSIPGLTTAMVVATAISVLGAIGSALLTLMTNHRLESRKATLQQELDQAKARLEGELEDRKASLQKEIEEFKAAIADTADAASARREYEYEARKRLYTDIEPLLFQLFEAAEGSFHAVTSLCRTQRQGHLPAWLIPGDYYTRSVIHRLFLPLAIFRLIQKSTTLIDLSLDPSIRLRYAVLKESYLAWTDDFGAAKLEPELRYEPNGPIAKANREANPAIHWRQGIVIGRLDRLAHALVSIDGGRGRPLNFGEFEKAIENDEQVREIYQKAEEIFSNFDFVCRPVLGRLLLVNAVLMHVLMTLYSRSLDMDDLEHVVRRYIASAEAKSLLCWQANDAPDSLIVVAPYIIKRLNQAMTAGAYAKF